MQVNEIIEEIMLLVRPDHIFDEHKLCFHVLCPYYKPEKRTHTSIYTYLSLTFAH